MPAPETTDTFLTVAELLVADPAPPDDLLSWAACENARARSAASRAYHSAFVALKLRLGPALRRLKRRFPSADAHRRVQQALDEAGHRAVRVMFEELRRERERADYEWSDTWDELRARDLVRKGRVLMARVAALSDAAIRAIAGRVGV